jgi:hypothetical protein
VAIGVIAWRMNARRAAAPLAAALAFFVVLILSHTVHPWYLLWPLPFAALAAARANDRAPCAPVFLWSATVFCAYAVLLPYRAAGVWSLPGWASLAEYVPVYACLLVVALRRHAAS